MPKHPVLLRTVAFLTLIGLVVVAYLLWARPYQLHWGATAEEISRAMPGDELNVNPKFLATRAITINGTPAEIWPWLVQMGFGRAGYYGYDILENLGSPRGIHSAEKILPEFQFAAPAFVGGRLQQWIRWLFLANGILALPIFLTYFVSRSFIYIAALWSVTIAGSAILLAIFFRRSGRAFRPLSTG